jgi:hypothetical protein
MPLLSQIPTEDLIQRLKTSQLDERSSISVTILGRGDAALSALWAAGARPMSGINPSLPDMLYTLISKQIVGRIRTTSFGLHVTANTTRQDVIAMGERRGFTLPDSSKFDPAVFPACYVVLTQGSDLLETMENIMKNERSVTGVNFNYFE